MHVPDDHSGSVQTTHTVINGLTASGHDCHMLATQPPGLKHLYATGMYRFTFRKFIPEWLDTSNGYPTRRGSEWRFAERVRNEITRLHPDVLILDALRQLRALDRLSARVPCPIALMIHESIEESSILELPEHYNVTYVANSPYTADNFLSASGKQAKIVPPAIDLSQYQTNRASPQFVTMISPTKPKGVQTTLNLARQLADTPFLLVEGWPMPKDQWQALEMSVADLPNVTLRRSTSDMKEIYQDTKVLLVPSQVNETFGRVVVEAQISGIPVLARDVGALGWTVGKGGSTIPASAPDHEWVDALESILNDNELYKRLSISAYNNATREEFNTRRVISAIESILMEAITQNRRGSEPIY